MRIAILIDGNQIPKWVTEIIKEISIIKDCYLAGIIQNSIKDSYNSHTPFRIFKKIDRIVLPVKSALFNHMSSGHPPGTLKLLLNPEIEKSNIIYSSDEIEKIVDLSADLILYFGSLYISSNVLKIPKFGIWYLHYGDVSRHFGKPPGFWEWFNKVPITDISLLKQSNQKHSCDFIAKTSTMTQFISYSRNLNSILSKCIDLVVDSVATLISTGTYTLIQEPLLNYGKPQEEPGIWKSIQALGKLTSRIFSKTLTKILFIEQWVLFHSREAEITPVLNFNLFKSLMPPKDRIWADPFVVSEGDYHYVFIEEKINKSPNGYIACLVLNSRGRIDKIEKILERPYHLSYPFLFKHNKRWYMIPESGENRTVDLYECTEFPMKWKFKRTLLSNVSAYDATPLFFDDKFWLFCTIQKRPTSSTNEELYLFYTNDFLTGELKSHIQNPVISNPSKARPAGKIFYHNGYWYRPSQNCTNRYGYGLNLNKIVELNEENYKEELTSAALPFWRNDLLSMHTLNFTDKITFIDGQIKRLKY